MSTESDLEAERQRLARLEGGLEALVRASPAGVKDPRAQELLAAICIERAKVEKLEETLNRAR